MAGMPSSTLVMPMSGSRIVLLPSEATVKGIRKYKVDIGGGTAFGSPSDAIKLIRQRLGKSFRDAEPAWFENVQRAVDVLSKKRPQFPNEDERAYAHRLEEEVISQRPPFVKQIEARVRLMVFILGQPSNKMVGEDILPKLDYWHHRSGQHVDIVCLGFSDCSDETFDGKAFNQLVRMFKDFFNWDYSGDTDLLLFSARYNAHFDEAVLDMSTVVCLTLERAIEDKAITSVSAFIERIVRVAESDTTGRPAWTLSDYEGRRIGGSALKEFALSLLPESVRSDAKKALHFYVRDLNRKLEPG